MRKILSLSLLILVLTSGFLNARTFTWHDITASMGTRINTGDGYPYPFFRVDLDTMLTNQGDTVIYTRTRWNSLESDSENPRWGCLQEQYEINSGNDHTNGTGCQILHDYKVDWMIEDFNNAENFFYPNTENRMRGGRIR